MNIKVKQEFIKLSSADRIQINLRCLVFRGHQEDKMYLWQALTLNVSLNPLQAIRVLLLPDALVHLKNPQKHIEWSPIQLQDQSQSLPEPEEDNLSLSHHT